jgi:hypothetical protein
VKKTIKEINYPYPFLRRLSEISSMIDPTMESSYIFLQGQNPYRPLERSNFSAFQMVVSNKIVNTILNQDVFRGDDKIILRNQLLRFIENEYYTEMRNFFFNKIKNNINENENLNEYGFTEDEMKKIEEYVIDSVKEHYKWLKKQVEDAKEDWDWLKTKLSLKHLSQQEQDMIKKQFIDPKLKTFERNKHELDNFNFEQRVKDGIKNDIYGGAYSMSYKIRYDKWKKEALTRNLSKQDIIDLFVTALEGGSNYWYLMDLPNNIKSYGDYTSEAVGEYILQGGYIEFYDVEEYREVQRNFRNGYYDISGDLKNEKEYQEDLEKTKLGYVDMDKILDTIPVLKKNYPKIWENILLENADAGDADVFLQLCVMGDVVFG